MLTLALARLTLPAVVGRRLNEGLGRTMHDSANDDGSEDQRGRTDDRHVAHDPWHGVTGEALMKMPRQDAERQGGANQEPAKH
jgi:hypothetical protein